MLKLVYENFLISKSEILFYGIKFVPNFKWYYKKPYLYPKLEESNLFISYFSNGTRSYAWGTPGKAFQKNF